MVFALRWRLTARRPEYLCGSELPVNQSQSYPFVLSVDIASDSFMQTAEMLLEKNATLTIWRASSAALCHRRGGRVWYAGEQWLADAIYHLCIEPPLWRYGPTAELPHLPAAGYPDDIGHVTERERRHKWTPLFSRGPSGAGVLCAVRGVGPGVSGAAVGGGGDFLL